MKLAVIIPSRGDRPELLQNCLRMMKNQTLPIFRTEIMDFNPRDSDCDITKRYRLGYDTFRHLDYDLIAFIEDDDWYAPDYLEYMVNEWKKRDCPDMMGTTYTIYYHLKLRKYFTMRHSQRSSAMNMFLKPDLNLSWPLDKDPFADQWLWMHYNGKKELFEPSKIRSIGMKHGIGKTGGDNHVKNLHRYINDDQDMYFLQQTIDAESFWFYKTYSDKLKTL